MLLDTCAILWLAMGNESKGSKDRLSLMARKKIDEAPVVYVSTISAFEIALKVHNGKIILPAQTDTWMETIITHHNLAVIPLDMNICIEAVQLPLIHRDPCDRFIIATAKLHNLKIVTKDHLFNKYGVEIIE